ncbi:MAG: flagellar hook capping FlgD N-terminal domain-containing protein [Pseudomonadota bacterium]
MPTDQITSLASSTSSASASATPPVPASADTATTGAISSDFDTFLQLLTAQLQNQDPLNPLDSTEFVAQLAQFSAVEQQVLTNSALGRIEAAVGGGGELTQWLGAEVSAPVAAAFDGAPIAGEYAADVSARSAVLEVESATGAQVALIPLTPGARTVEWDGKTFTGEDAAPGFYRLVARETDSAGEVTETPVSVFARVEEARRDAEGAVTLVFESGDSASSVDIAAARRPSTGE